MIKIKIFSFIILGTIYLISCSIDSKNKNTKYENKSLIKKNKTNSFLFKKTPNFSAITIHKRKIDSTYFMGKITLINFMYINCSPCIEELSFLKLIYKKIPNKNFQMIFIAPNTPNQMELFMPKIGVSRNSKFRDLSKFIFYDIIAECPIEDILGNPTGSGCRDISKKFLIGGYPTTLIVDYHRNIRFRYTGFSKLHPPPLESKIRYLLNEPFN